MLHAAEPEYSMSNCCCGWGRAAAIGGARAGRPTPSLRMDRGSVRAATIFTFPPRYTGGYSGVAAGLRLAAVGGMSFAYTHADAPAYRRRTPEKEPLYQVLAEHLETFLTI